MTSIKNNDSSNNAFLFGGVNDYDNGVIYNDSWIFDNQTKKWIEIKIDSNISVIPSKRKEFSLLTIEDSKVFLSGGSQWADSFNEIWTLDLKDYPQNIDSIKWNLISTDFSDYIHWSSKGCQLNGNLILFLNMNDAAFYDFKSNDWVLKREYKNLGNERSHYNLIGIDNNIAFLFGGVASNGHLGDTWIYYNDSSLVSIYENVTEENLISPNPASDFIEINVGAQRAVPDAVTPVRIFDILGVEVLINSQLLMFNSQLRIYVSGLSPGVYFVRVGDVVKKFVKM